jgi:hypothetical protein
MRTHIKQTVWVVGVLVALLAAPLYLHAQQIGNYAARPDDDGRLNYDYYMEGIGVYCADAAHIPWDTYKGGGGFTVVVPHPEHPGGLEVLWVPEDAIEAGIAQMRETGTYATLGVAEGGKWFDPQPAIYYLTSEEFQLNVMGPGGATLYEFQWTECHEVPKVTDDGCPPGSDPDEFGNCD